ncbi:hypothetical protein Pdw03_5678 [Penicillium digitatum]|uniref:Uncharacterized protein n=3 Tax=Penicillium digitatum TaxID=36651 RepID=K9F830_PEND2|nr:hypothetical protein PDIP_07730 [Penicillium digitatum Pd1]EKV04217.1 hypothetical protein PDIG_90810 [Penicillium digitatum PHI26]EKV21344.1 hypothetical protein PDIP_07730 [Penicillium digitatum Pd1]QQK48043.1 hypothetical protein Pdw03_5678 [Penicillium digitatum]
MTQAIVHLLSSLDFGEVGSLLGSSVGGLDSIIRKLKHAEPSPQNVFSLTHPTLLGLLSGLDLSTVPSLVGNVVAMPPSVSKLKSKIPNITGADFIAVKTEKKASVRLIKVDGTAIDSVPSCTKGALSL